MTPLSLLFGAVVGISLGLTGGGGSLFAVPLLVYGMRMPAREAVGVSLAAVGATALAGFLDRWRAGQIDFRTGLLFAGAGMLGAPLGSRIADGMPESLLLGLFAGLMVIVAAGLWRKSVTEADRAAGPSQELASAPACRRDAAGSLMLTSRCIVLLLVVGLLTGILSGMFGVGGGFVIVPALVLFSGMAIHRAVATSLLVITLVSIAGVGAHVSSGQVISLAATGMFAAGGVAGLFVGQSLGRRMSAARLQRVFAVAILGVAVWVIVRNVVF